MISPRHQVSTSTVGVQSRPDSPPQLGSPSTSSMSSSLISAITSPNETPKHVTFSSDNPSQQQTAAITSPNLLITDAVSPPFNVSTNNSSTSSKLTQSFPIGSLQYTSSLSQSQTEGQSIALNDLLRDYQFSPSVRYNISSSSGDTKDVITSSASDGDDHSTLTLSSLSALSKPSLFSPNKPNITAAILTSSLPKDTTTAGSGTERGVISSYVTPTELSTSLSATKLQLQLELEKVNNYVLVLIITLIN